MKILKISTEEMKTMGVGNMTRYVVAIDGWPLEPVGHLARRIEMWDWMVTCLMKGKEKGPYSYLVDHVGRYDVTALYTLIIQSVDIQNPFVFWRSFVDFVNAQPAKDEDIFSYFTRLQKMASGLSIRDPEAIGISDVKVVSNLALKVKMLDATSFYDGYRSFAQRIRSQKPSQWLKMGEADILEALRILHDNSVSMGPRITSASQAVNRGPVRNEEHGPEAKREGQARGRSKSRGPDRARGRSRSAGASGCPKGSCWQFWNEGKCARSQCKFEHVRGTKSEDRLNEGSKPKACSRCGAKDHDMYSCTYAEDCSYCGKRGHKAALCRKKQADDGKRGTRGPSTGPSSGPVRPTTGTARPTPGPERPASRQARFAMEEAEQVEVRAEARDDAMDS